MASNYFLDGSMIPRSETRSIDERAELRHPSLSSTAVLEFRGRKHVVRLVNLSRGGAMVIFAAMPHIGEEVRLHLLGRSQVLAHVRWVREGRIGVSFAEPLE